MLHISLVLMMYSTNIMASEIKDYPLDKIGNNTYVIHGPLEYPNIKNKGFMNNPGFIVTKTSVVVIDPGSSLYVGRMLLRKIKTVTNKPISHVLNTHVHGDHWLGNHAFSEAFPKVIIMAHPDMINRANKGAAEHWISLMLNITGGATKGTKAVIPNKKLIDQSVFEVGGVKFRIHAPEKAHSFTDIMIELVNEKIIFLGDNVSSKRMPGMNDGTFKGNVKACKIAIALNAKTYVPGHGKSGSKEKVIVPFMEYLKTIYAEVGKKYEAGMSDFEMKPYIVDKLKAYSDWSGFHDEVGKHISLAVLEYEQDSF